MVTNENSKIANEAIFALLSEIEKHVFIGGGSINGKLSISVASIRTSIGNLFESDSELESDCEQSNRKGRMRPEWKLQYQALLLLSSLSKVQNIFFITSNVLRKCNPNG